MNCIHCHQLIESGPLAELSPAQSDALQRHTQSCTECGRLLASAQHLERTLADLPDPVLPEGLEASIMQRVFEDHADQALAVVSPAKEKRRPLGQMLLGGLLAIGTELLALTSGQAALPSTDALWQPAAQPLAGMPHGNLGVLVLAIGLLLMLSGLTQATDTQPALRNGKPHRH